jgi:nucleotide-binding universal stress UspA family protein
MRKSIISVVRDGSAKAGAAAKVSGRLARDLDLRLVLVHVADDSPGFPYRDRRRREAQRRRAIRHGRELLEPVAAAIPEVNAEIEVVLRSETNGLGSFLKRQMPQLIVMGSDGDLAELAREADCPLVAVPPGAARRFFARDLVEWPSIVCGLDGSDESWRAMRVARRLAEGLHVELTLGFVDESGPWPEAPEEVRVEVGDPVEGLRELAGRDGVRLIVVGSRGYGRLASALLGSVSRDLVASAPVPVVIVPPGARVPDFGKDVSRSELTRAA